MYRVVSADSVQVHPVPGKGRDDLYFPLQALLAKLPQVVVHGIPTIQRCVINRKKDDRFELFAEGTNLRVRCCFVLCACFTGIYMIGTLPCQKNSKTPNDLAFAGCHG